MKEGHKDTVSDIHLSYIQSMCNKKLKDHERAAEGYKALLKHIKLSESKLTFKYVWGMLLILRCQDRKFVANQLDTFKELMDFYKPPEGEKTYIDVLAYLETHYTITQLQVKEEPYAEQLQRLSFFRRFTVPQIIGMFPDMLLRKYDAQEVLIVDDSRIAVVLSGMVLMKSHEKDILPPKLLARL